MCRKWSHTKSNHLLKACPSNHHFLVGRCSISGDGKGQLLIKDEERSDYIILSEEVMVSFTGESFPLKLSHGEFELLILWVTRPFP